MTRDKFKLIHSELIMQVQCIEHDLKLIYAGMCKGDFDKNLDALEKVNLGSMIKKVKELDYSDGHPDLTKRDYICLLYTSKKGKANPDGISGRLQE